MHQVIRSCVQVDVLRICDLLRLVLAFTPGATRKTFVSPLRYLFQGEENAELNIRHEGLDEHSLDDGPTDLLVPALVEVSELVVNRNERQEGESKVGIGEHKQNTSVNEGRNEDGGHHGTELLRVSLIANHGDQLDVHRSDDDVENCHQDRDESRQKQPVALIGLVLVTEVAVPLGDKICLARVLLAVALVVSSAMLVQGGVFVDHCELSQFFPRWKLFHKLVAIQATRIL